MGVVRGCGATFKRSASSTNAEEHEVLAGGPGDLGFNGCCEAGARTGASGNLLVIRVRNNVPTHCLFN